MRKGGERILSRILRYLNFSSTQAKSETEGVRGKRPLKAQPVGEGCALCSRSLPVGSTPAVTRPEHLGGGTRFFPGHLTSRAGLVAPGSPLHTKACWFPSSLLEGVFRISINPAYQKFSPQQFLFGSLNPSAATLPLSREISSLSLTRNN